MKYGNNKYEDIKIAYIGGGSRGWAWGFMSDLAVCEDMCGTVYLYDIDLEAAKKNEKIGNGIKDIEGCKSQWKYKAVETEKEALEGADFVIISILPGTFDEMESDVHTPEKYNIYQSVGDTAGPGGILRALRTIPMFEEIAENIKKYCPDAWVINYTNPMTMCVKTLYKVFPEIKAFGCCHEVFGTQKLLVNALEDIKGIKDVKREDIKVNVVRRYPLLQPFPPLARRRFVRRYPLMFPPLPYRKKHTVPHRVSCRFQRSFRRPVPLLYLDTTNSSIRQLL